MGESEKQLENDEERNMATIKDIAARAGVTATTVSRVINNRGYISEETRKKVTQAMQDIVYWDHRFCLNFQFEDTNLLWDFHTQNRLHNMSLTL